MKRKLVSLGTVLSVCTALLLPYGGFAATAPTTAYGLTISGSQSKIGQEISVTVKAENVSDLYGYDLGLHFDPEHLEYVGMSAGLSGGYSVTPSAGSDRAIDLNLRQGDILFGYTKTGSAQGENGNVTLGTIRFKAKAAGTAAVSLEHVKLIHSDSKLAAETAEPHSEVKTTIAADGGTNPTPTPTPTPPSTQNPPTPTPTPDGVVTVFEIKDGRATATLDANHSRAAFPLDQVSGKELRVIAGNAAVTLKSGFVAALIGKAQDAKGATVIVSAIPVQAASVAGLAAEPGAKIKIAGQVYDIKVLLRTADGHETPIKETSDGVEISFTYDAAQVDESLLGIYYLNETTGRWEYVGGSADPAAKQISALVPHLSKYAALEYDKTYADVPANHWVYQTLKALSAKHIVNGVTDTEFRPSGKTTRAEFAALLVRGLALKPSGTAPAFEDVSASAWYANDVAAAYSAGLIQGLSDTKFAPNAGITREQMAAMLVRAYAYMTQQSVSADDKLQAYSDREAVSAWARTEVNQAIALGLMQGKKRGVFDPSSSVVRAETSQALFNLISKKG